MRSSTVWRGALSFGLVNINIELYSAIKQHSLGFNLLHAKCHTPIKYERWCPRCNKEVSWDDIVKGLKLSDGTYFILTKEALAKLKQQKTDYINIIEFIDSGLLDTIYLNQHYYIAPSRATDKAFFLFMVALKKMNKIAIGQFVLRDKQYVCAIQPYKNCLLLTTLNYNYEIKKVAKIEELHVLKIEAKELKLAEQLIDKLNVKKFDISQFKDNFAQELQKHIKQSSKKIALPKIKKLKEKKLSLVEDLQASLKEKKSKIKKKEK